MGDFSVESLNSVRQALSIATMRKSINADATTVATLLNGMQEANSNALELSVAPHKGGNIDVRV